MTTLFLLAISADFSVTSPQFKNNETLKDEQVWGGGMGCAGKNVSPALEWKNAPAGTKSFAVTAYDPDAPTGSGWWHWLIFNIPATTTKLDLGAGDATKGPAGTTQSRTDYGAYGYNGPCPPPGAKPHRYIFTVFALKTEKIEADKDASGAMVGFMLNANALGKATLTGKYGR